jgi:O-antigen/teichoic acid export membrane protein
LIFPAGALLVIDLMSQIQLRSGSVILRHTRDLTEVGLYTAPARLLEGFALVPAAISVALLPRLVGAHRDHPGAAAAEVRLSLRFTAALGAAILVALGPWAAEIIHALFGASYAASASALRLLLVVQLLMMLNAVLRAALIATGSERAYAALMALAGALGVVAALLVTPRWGASGAAASALAGELVLLLGGQALSVRRLPDVLPIREWGIIGIATALGLAVIVVAKGVTLVPAAIATLALVVVGFETLSPISLREFLPRRRSASGPPVVR